MALLLGVSAVGVNAPTEDGKPALRLTQPGAQVGRALAMAGEDADVEAMLAALLEGNAP